MMEPVEPMMEPVEPMMEPVEPMMEPVEPMQTAVVVEKRKREPDVEEASIFSSLKKEKDEEPCSKKCSLMQKKLALYHLLHNELTSEPSEKEENDDEPNLNDLATVVKTSRRVSELEKELASLKEAHMELMTKYLKVLETPPSVFFPFKEEKNEQDDDDKTVLDEDEEEDGEEEVLDIYNPWWRMTSYLTSFI
jgi:transcriptional regulator with XRE-family HTH domain